MLHATTDPEGVVFLRLARAVAGRPLYKGGAYLLGNVLLDCGPPATAREVLAWLGGRTVDALLVTHHHEDHSGGAALLLEKRGLVAHIHASGVRPLHDGYEQQLYRRLVWGRPLSVQARPLPPVVDTGGVRLEVVETPGHSPDHVCFYDRSRGWLFTGDLFLGERQRYLREDEDLEQIIGSLRAATALPLERVFCAHRGPLRDGPAALRRRLDNLTTVRDRLRELMAQGLPDAEIARRVVGPEGPLTWISRGRFSARNFVKSLKR
ncbi:MAG TPA: MBL fold metallo-hydrolase [Vicinamibacteria bacterium]|nr:MBL fold metallo-hydrolase [Vicinamibacteria bacterium]